VVPWETPPFQVSLVPPAVLLISVEAAFVGLGPAVVVEFAQAELALGSQAVGWQLQASQSLVDLG
jgi:hypothetical protein